MRFIHLRSVTVFSLSTFIDSFKIGCHLYTQLRERAWFGSSVKSRLQYLGPCPGLPIPDDDLIKDAHLDPSAGPVDAFCLLVLDPEKVGSYFRLFAGSRKMLTFAHAFLVLFVSNPLILQLLYCT